MVSGIQTDVMGWLKIKTQDMAPRERDCVLILDEVQFQQKLEYCMSAKSHTGYVSYGLGDEKEEASYALVYMIKGLCKPYK